MLTRNWSFVYRRFLFFLFFSLSRYLQLTPCCYGHDFSTRSIKKKINEKISEIFVSKTALSTLLSARCGKIKETYFFSSALGLRRTGAIHHILMALSVAEIQIYINRTMSGKTTKNRGNLTLHPLLSLTNWTSEGQAV